MSYLAFEIFLFTLALKSIAREQLVYWRMNDPGSRNHCLQTSPLHCPTGLAVLRVENERGLGKKSRNAAAHSCYPVQLSAVDCVCYFLHRMNSTKAAQRLARKCCTASNGVRTIMSRKNAEKLPQQQGQQTESGARLVPAAAAASISAGGETPVCPTAQGSSFVTSFFRIGPRIPSQTGDRSAAEPLLFNIVPLVEFALSRQQQHSLDSTPHSRSLAATANSSFSCQPSRREEPGPTGRYSAPLLRSSPHAQRYCDPQPTADRLFQALVNETAAASAAAVSGMAT